MIDNLDKVSTELDAEVTMHRWLQNNMAGWDRDQISTFEDKYNSFVKDFNIDGIEQRVIDAIDGTITTRAEQATARIINQYPPEVDEEHLSSIIEKEVRRHLANHRHHSPQRHSSRSQNPRRSLTPSQNSSSTSDSTRRSTSRFYTPAP